MNNRRDRHTELLRAAFHDEWARTEGFAQQAAARARRHRALRRVAGRAAVVVLVAVSSFAAWHANDAAQRAHLPLRPATPGYEIISDDQLLAELRDRPLLVMRSESGAREFVFLPE